MTLQKQLNALWGTWSPLIRPNDASQASLHPTLARDHKTEKLEKTNTSHYKRSLQSSGCYFGAFIVQCPSRRSIRATATIQ